MSGPAVIRHLLAASGAVTAIVPATKIILGDLSLNVILPAISVRGISGTPNLSIAMTEPNRLHTDRVQVSVLTKEGSGAGTGYNGVRAVLALLLAACPNQRGTVNGISVDSILPDIEGPDLRDPESAIYQGSRDFIVKWRS